MRTKNRVYRDRVGFGLLCFFGAALGFAQQSTPATGAPSEESVVLSPFIVNSDKDTGYVATDTLAGSRFGTKLADTPATLSVLTAEFLADTGAFDMTAALSYATNVEFGLDDDRPAINGQITIGSYQTYRVRGLATTQARNYFPWDVPSNTYNADRYEDSRGPNSILFGIASPGGLMNVVTKRAQPRRSFGRTSLTMGSHNSHRAALDLNQAAGADKFAVRLNAVKDRSNGFRHWTFTDSQLADLAATYNVNRRMQIRGEVECGQIDSNIGRTYTMLDTVLLWNSKGRPTFATQAANAALGVGRQSTAANTPRVTYIGNNKSVIAMAGTMTTTGDSESMITDTRIADYSIGPVGPGRNRTSRFSNLSAFVDYEIARKTYVQVAYNHQGHKFDRYDPAQNANSLKGNPNQVLPNGTADPYAGLLYVEIDNGFRIETETQSDSARAMFGTEWDAGKWGHYRVGTYYDYLHAYTGGHRQSEVWFDAATGKPAFNATPEASQNRVYRRQYATEHKWSTYHADTPFRTGLFAPVVEPVSRRTLYSDWVGGSTGGVYETYNTQNTFLLAGQARYFGGRLILAAGLRRDDLTAHGLGSRRDPITNEIVQAHRNADATLGSTYTTDSVGRTKTAGTVYHLTPWLSFTGNFADNVQPQSNTSALVIPPSGEPGHLVSAPLPRGVGRDYGLRLALWDGRLNVRATYYTTKSENNSTTFSLDVRDTNTRILDALRGANLITQAEYDLRSDVGTNNLYGYKSDGYEFEVTANLTKDLRFHANYSITDAIQNKISLEWKAWDKQNVAWLSKFNTAALRTSAGRTIAQEISFYEDLITQTTATDGVSNLGSRREKVNFFARYSLPFERLKGVYVGGGYLHQSKMFVGVDSAGRSRYGNSYWRADAMAGYTRRLERSRAVTIQLNVKNIFNQIDPLVTRYTTAGAITRWAVQPPATWQLTTTFEF